MMDERRKSDKPVLPMKSSNKAGLPVAERMEGRGLTKGKPQQQNASRTPSRSDAPTALERIPSGHLGPSAQSSRLAAGCVRKQLLVGVK